MQYKYSYVFERREASDPQEFSLFMHTIADFCPMYAICALGNVYFLWNYAKSVWKHFTLFCIDVKISAIDYSVNKYSNPWRALKEDQKEYEILGG